jgi:hypothetical protein
MPINREWQTRIKAVEREYRAVQRIDCAAANPPARLVSFVFVLFWPGGSGKGSFPPLGAVWDRK